MGFFSKLFKRKNKKRTKRTRPDIPYRSKAMLRLSKKSGMSVSDLMCHFDEDVMLEELMLLGLMLSEDGTYYYDNPSYVDAECSPHDCSGCQVQDSVCGDVYTPEPSYNHEPVRTAYDDSYSSSDSDYDSGGGSDDCGGCDCD